MSSYLPGLARVAYAFPLGVLIQKGHRAGRLKRLGGLSPLLLLLLLVAPLVLPNGLIIPDSIVDAACIFIVFPFVLCAAVETRAAPSYAWIAGAISYPLYATHMTLRPAVEMLVMKGVSGSASVLIMMVSALALGLMLQYWLEPSFRRTHRPRGVDLDPLLCASVSAG